MSSPTIFPGRTAIAGLGVTEFSKNSGRTELRLALEAIHGALNDAGITPAEVDGFVSYSIDKVPEYEVARLLGAREVTFFSQIPHGGGAACAPVLHAAMAVATGIAKTVVVYRAMNERSWYRFGSGSYGFASTPIFENVNFGWYMPHGFHTPSAWVAMFARRYMHAFGATSEDFGRVSVAVRDFAATNPAAFFHGKPITLEEHQASRWKAKPVFIRGGAQGIAPGQQIMTSLYRDDITGLPEMGLVARQLWQQSGLTPADIQTAVIYDHFTPFVLQQLEEFGFCGRGEAKDFVRAGHHARRGLHPRHERHRRGRAPGARQRGQPGGGSAQRAGHRRHRRAHQRPDPRRGMTQPCSST